jgi:hypothetical protein
MLIGALLLGISVGREQAMRTLTDVLRGNGSLSELQRRGLAGGDRRQSFSTQGTLVEHKQHFIVLEDTEGRLRSVQITPETKIKVGTKPGEEKDIVTGSTIAVIGQPMPDGGIRALVLQVEQ